MATFVKIRGLDRVASGNTSSLAARGFRAKSGYGQQFPAGVKATATGGATTSAVTVTAKYGGTWANGHTFTRVAGGADHNVAIVVTYAAGTAVPTFTYTAGTLTTANELATALNANPLFAALYTATGGGTGTTLVSVGALAGGTNVGTGQSIEVPVTGLATAVVDIDDAFTLRQLYRMKGRWLSLGQV
jgi:hypothetical protein